jgi:hypothetical protein
MDAYGNLILPLENGAGCNLDEKQIEKLKVTKMVYD